MMFFWIRLSSFISGKLISPWLILYCWILLSRMSKSYWFLGPELSWEAEDFTDLFRFLPWSEESSLNRPGERCSRPWYWFHFYLSSSSLNFFSVPLVLGWVPNLNMVEKLEPMPVDLETFMLDYLANPSLYLVPNRPASLVWDRLGKPPFGLPSQPPQQVEHIEYCPIVVDPLIEKCV